MTDRQRFELILQWMTENLEVGSSVYRTRRGLVRVDPGLVATSNGQVVRRHSRHPRDLEGWLLNSAVALIACCYIDALGRVCRKGSSAKKKGENLRRFKAFVTRHMRDFTAECRRRGGRFSIKTLYATYRNGFAHQFAGRNAHWKRCGRTAPYWFSRRGCPGINVDRLVRGVIKAVAEFQAQFPNDLRYGKQPYKNFFRWLGV